MLSTNPCWLLHLIPEVVRDVQLNRFDSTRIGSDNSARSPAVSKTIARLDIDFLDYHIARVGRGGMYEAEGMGANVFVG